MDSPAHPPVSRARASHATTVIASRRAPASSQPTVTTPTWPCADPHGGAQDDAPRAIRVGATVASRFHLLARLGEGGVGEVWRAEDLHTGHQVAVKVLRPELGLDEVRLARFIREGRLALALRHPHIVEVIAVGRAQDVPFLAMELLPGPCLQDLVTREGPLPWARVRPLLLQLCHALAHAHERSIVHHDVKPSNVVLSGGPGQPEQGKLVDFGIARRNLLDEPDVELTVEGQMLGSPGYMSPEQIRGKRVDPASDLFGLGCTAFFLLTGRDPFEAHSLPALIHSTLFRPSPALDDIGVDPALHQAIEAMIHRALEKDPADRFGSAKEMAAAIEAIDAG